MLIRDGLSYRGREKALILTHYIFKPELVAPGHSVIRSLISMMVKREYHKSDRLIVKERGMCRRPTGKGIILPLP